MLPIECRHVRAKDRRIVAIPRAGRPAPTRLFGSAHDSSMRTAACQRALLIRTSSRMLRMRRVRIARCVRVWSRTPPWDHIHLTGDYHWHANKRVAKGGFRPLRRVRSTESTVGAPERT